MWNAQLRLEECFWKLLAAETVRTLPKGDWLKIEPYYEITNNLTVLESGAVDIPLIFDFETLPSSSFA